MKVIDTTGQVCPAPIIAAKKALKETQEGDSFTVLTDNRTSFNNLSRFLTDNGAKFNYTENNGTWTIIVTKGPGKKELIAEDYCKPEIPHFTRGNFIIAFSSDKMGEGDDELGRLLIMNFIKAIHDLDILPSKMVFYNRGVLLGKNDSAVIDLLKDLETMGVLLFLCGTCLKHYSVEAQVRIGSVSNMFEIAQIMASAESVIKP